MSDKPFSVDAPARATRTHFLPIAQKDWVAITRGLKTEYRRWPRRQAGGQLAKARKLPRPPLPIIAYSRSALTRRVETAVMLLEEVHTEPLGALSERSLEREGIATREDFVRYWNARHTGSNSRGWAPLDKVVVWSLRPATREELADALYHRIIGEVLEEIRA